MSWWGPGPSAWSPPWSLPADGYIGLIADLDDDCRGYFARLAR
ncbi:hypothetical protein [Trebonia kvetii]|nr:hypothetical protein [Trebonia kvetii]